MKCIDDLREKREEVNRQILASEEEKAKIQKDLSILTERLQKINENLVRKTQARNEYDKTIQETEAAYMKARIVCQIVSSIVNCTRFEHHMHGCCPCIPLLFNCLLFALHQILESSQTLLHVLKRESINLSKKKQSSE